MKIIIMTTILSLFAVGCTPQIQPSFENSNQRFIEKTISKLDIAKELEDKINTKDRIALLSIEPPNFLHKPIIAMIEDQVIASLIQQGYTLVERDAEAIQKMIREGEEKYSLTFKTPSENITYEEITGDALEPGISFLEHIFVEDFRLDDPGASAKVYADNKSETYDIYFQEFEEFTLVYAVIS